MPKGKRHSPEQIVAIVRRTESGEAAATVFRETNIGAKTFHSWKIQCGGMQLTELPQLRGLRDENARLKRIVADQVLHIKVLKEVNGNKGELGAQTSNVRERGEGRLVLTPKGVSLSLAGPFDATLCAASGYSPTNTAGERDLGVVARSSAV